MTRFPHLRVVLAGLAAAALAGCGFHLAGSRPLPDSLKQVRIDMVLEYEVGEPPLEAALRERLQRRGAEVTSKLKDGVTVIRLTELKETRQVLSVGPDGKALEYELITRVTFDARTGTHLWQPPQQIEARQPYSFNAQQVLAKEQEADRLRAYLQGELADLLLLRLESSANRVEPQAPIPDVAPPAPSAEPSLEQPPEPPPAS